MVNDDGNDLFHVRYQDFDEEELDLWEIIDAVCYHPVLDSHHDIRDEVLPDVGEMILSAWNYQPRIGQVKEISSGRKPIVMQLWKPHRQAADLVSAHYIPSLTDDDPDLISLNPAQVKARHLRFDDKGYIYILSSSRTVLKKLLQRWHAR